ncbi:MAG: sigma-70 family RNA polymerase sigma factor [Bacteroidia bacterium]|nr:sigma-70 family RNA polymerase sigma factor [Bacteroidia bacterium]
MTPQHRTDTLVDHLFRQEAGKMVAVLTRVFGFRHVEIAEDLVQETMLSALSAWRLRGLPERPAAWLYRTARNKALDYVRRDKRFRHLSGELARVLEAETGVPEAADGLFEPEAIKDSQLRMMFACCHPIISQESQMVLILKTLCGLSVQEIATAFLSSKDSIEKRLYRTREKIREAQIALDAPALLLPRLDAVLNTLYLLFSEGYHSAHPDQLIRQDLCGEALRLALLLAEQPHTATPALHALLALMCFHSSRLDARLDDNQQVLLLEDQDRSRWNYPLIGLGLKYLQQSAQGELLTEYHLEAAIASYYCTAPAFEATDWPRILQLYDRLIQLKQNPVFELNRAVVLARVAGYEAALQSLDAIQGLEKHPRYHGARAEFLCRLGRQAEADAAFGQALALTVSRPERELLERRRAACGPAPS